MKEKSQLILPVKLKEEAFTSALTKSVWKRQESVEACSVTSKWKFQKRHYRTSSQNWRSMKKKVINYLGFAKKSGNVMAGVNTCTFGMNKGKVKLMILAEDISENSEKKIMKEIRKHGVEFIKYGNSEELSHAIGSQGRSVFAICDDKCAEVIKRELYGENR